MSREELDIANRCHLIMVDARGPSAAKPPPGQLLHEHVGTHPTIMEQVMSSKAFVMDIGMQLKAQWPKEPLAEHDAIGVIVFCQSGKHRSVAWSYLIQALALAEGYNGKVSQVAMSVGGMCHQEHCNMCSMPTPHSIFTQAIVKLSKVGHD